MLNMPIAIVDGSHSRRASLARRLTESGRHVEPYQDFGEFSKRLHKHELLLVHDESDLVEEVAHWCDSKLLPVALMAYSERVERKAVVRALKAGAIDYLSWPAANDELETELASSLSEIETRLKQIQSRAEARERMSRLTPREREVLEGLMRGLSNQDIASELNISPRTVEIHRANMLSKMRANNSPDAVRIAYEAR